MAFLFTAFCSWSAYAEEIYTGSGFFITTNGYFITNYHVIKDADKIGLRDVHGKTYNAVVVKMDINNDIALLKVNGKFSALPIINSQTVKRGTHVITVGFPNIDIQGKEPKLSDGIVSALSGIQDEPTVFQISVPIQPGNSGGPLVNMDGNVVGIISSKLSTIYMLENKGSVPENVNYAIKSNYLYELVRTDNVVSKLLLPPTKRPAKNLIELSGRVEKSIALVVVAEKSVNVKELAVQCVQALKEIREGKDADADVLNSCKQAADKGDAYVQNMLGYMYWQGKWVPEDHAEGIRWYHKAAEQGNIHAQIMLGILYRDGNGVPQDYAESLRWFHKAAEQGNAVAQFFIGSMYYQGQGVLKNAEESARWLLMASEQGDSGAQLSLGDLYRVGFGVPKDASEAFRWYSKAAEQGNVIAQFILGLMYRDGEGVSKDFVQAHMWFDLAAAGGEKFGAKYSNDLEQIMPPEQVVEAQRRAAEWKPTSSGDSQPTAPFAPK